MKIGLLFAMPAEFHAMPGSHDVEPFETIAGIPFFEVAPDIIACAAGVGKVNAAMGAQLLCTKFGVNLIVNSGVAGCAEDFPIGTIVVAKDFVQHDMDTTAIGQAHGEILGMGCLEFPTWNPTRVHELLVSLGIEAQIGRVATGDWFATNTPRASWICDTFHPLLLEMEGGSMAQVCWRNGVHFVSVKSVSDRLFSENQTDEFFDFPKAMEQLGAIALPLALALQKEVGLN